MTLKEFLRRELLYEFTIMLTDESKRLKELHNMLNNGKEVFK